MSHSPVSPTPPREVPATSSRFARNNVLLFPLLLVAAGLIFILLGRGGQTSTSERTDADWETALLTPAAALSPESAATATAIANAVLATPTVAPDPDIIETYCLWPGDTISTIAENAGVSTDDLLAMNPNWSGQAGTVIRLPQGSIPPAQWTSPLPAVSRLEDLPFGISGYYIGRNNREKKVALSFDVGYAEGNLERMEMLAKRGIRGTFFVLGGALDNHPDIISQILDNGHELGNHSYTHENMLYMTPDNVAWELQITEQLTQKALPGSTTKPLFRAPFGAINESVVNVANREGYHVIGWTVDSRDWTEEITADDLYQRVVEHVCPGAIIAFHDVNAANGPALPRLLDYLDRNGYKYVTVSQILSP